MMGSSTSYTDGFDPVSDSEWRTLVEKTLKGKPFDKVMRTASYDDIAIEALYTPATASAPTQGAASTEGRIGAWHIDTGHWNPDAKATNAAILDDLERGATSITLRTEAGHFPGIKPADFDTVLNGVFLDLAPINLMPGEGFEVTCDEYLKFLNKKKLQESEIKGTLGIDPAGVLAATGRLLSPIHETVKAAVSIAQTCAAAYPNLRAINIDTSAYHLAGATEAQELGVMLSTLAYYLRAFEAAGMSVEAASKQIEVSLAVDADIYLNIAKFRAARRLIDNLFAACGVENAKIAINGISSLRMMTVNDPWVNILRATSACFSAGVGGADRISIMPHDTLIGLSSRFARRIARNVQIILQEESSLAVVADPAAGSFAFETLTNEISENAWDYFQTLEAAGGIVSSLKADGVQRNLEAAWQKRAVNIAKRKDAITGVSEFPDIHEKPIDNIEENPAFITEVPTAGETVTQLPFHRYSESFEALRLLSDQCLGDTGKRPQIFLANLGPVAAHTARATYAKNFFEAGGVEALPSEGFTDTATLSEAFTASGAKVAVICGSDSGYDAQGLETAKSLKTVGCDYIYLAGKPANADELKTSGVDDFIFMGCDVLGTLEALMKRLTENAGDEK
jgi:methylmalonyl-CoA mutase